MVITSILRLTCSYDHCKICWNVPHALMALQRISSCLLFANLLLTCLPANCVAAYLRKDLAMWFFGSLPNRVANSLEFFERWCSPMFWILVPRLLFMLLMNLLFYFLLLSNWDMQSTNKPIIHPGILCTKPLNFRVVGWSIIVSVCSSLIMTSFFSTKLSSILYKTP